MASMHAKVRLLFLMTVIAVTTLACSRPSISVDDGSPPTFKLSGNYTAQYFEVSRKDGQTIWLVYVRGNEATLSDIASIKYGVVPSACCYQDIVTGAPPALEEGETYVAHADIFDASAVWIEFTIKNGKAVVSRSSAERGY
jgi:hypothetical protein